MSLGAQTIEPWEMDDIDCTEAYRTVEDPVMDESGNPVMEEVDDGEGGTVEIPKKVVRYERRNHYVIKLRRTAVGVHLFTQETGTLRSSFNMLTGPDTNITFASIGRSWRCTRDALQRDRMEVGTCLNEQTWEHYSKWEQINPADFGGGE